ncbi:MAG: hypothetical protein ACYCSG_02415 [Thermoplasmataceae archaeon]
MNPIVDLEIIKSALLYGEPSDAMNRIESRIEALQRNSELGGKIYSAHIEFLKKMADFIKGNLSTDELGSYLRSSKLFELEDYNSFVDAFAYFCEYSRDRYNLRYPSFDGKRCDDL